MAQKQSISRFLNFPASGIYSSEFIQTMQKYYEEAREQGGGNGKKFEGPALATEVQGGQAL